MIAITDMDPGASTYASAAEVEASEPSSANAEVISIFDLFQRKLEEQKSKRTDAEPDNSTEAARLDSQCASALAELSQYAALPRGWDGYSGREFNEVSVALATRLVRAAASTFRKLRQVPERITPGPVGDGSIDLELVFRHRALLLTISPNATGTHLYATSHDQPDFEADVALDQVLLGRWLSWLVSSDAGAPVVATA